MQHLKWFIFKICCTLFLFCVIVNAFYNFCFALLMLLCLVHCLKCSNLIAAIIRLIHSFISFKNEKMFCLYFIISACGRRLLNSHLDLNWINYFQWTKPCGAYFTLLNRHCYLKISSNHAKNAIFSLSSVISISFTPQTFTNRSKSRFYFSPFRRVKSICIVTHKTSGKRKADIHVFFISDNPPTTCPVVCPSSPLTLKNHWPYTRLNNKLEGGHRARREEWASQLDSLRNQLFTGRAEIKQTLWLWDKL